MTTPTPPQTVRQQVLHVCHRAALTRTPTITPREVQAAHRAAFGGYMELRTVKEHIQALVTAGQLERVGHRACKLGHSLAPVVRVPAGMAVPF